MSPSLGPRHRPGRHTMAESVFVLVTTARPPRRAGSRFPSGTGSTSRCRRCTRSGDERGDGGRSGYPPGPRRRRSRAPPAAAPWPRPPPSPPSGTPAPSARPRPPRGRCADPGHPGGRAGGTRSQPVGRCDAPTAMSSVPVHTRRRDAHPGTAVHTARGVHDRPGVCTSIQALRAHDPAQESWCGYVWPTGASKVSLITRGLVQRWTFSIEPALSFVPDARPPPKGWRETIEPVGRSLT